MKNMIDTSTTPFVKRDGINWITVTVLGLFHIGASIALFFFSWPAFFTAVGLYWMSLSLGIGMGYHRLLTHRSFEPPKWIEYLLAVCDISAGRWSHLVGHNPPVASSALR